MNRRFSSVFLVWLALTARVLANVMWTEVTSYGGSGTAKYAPDFGYGSTHSFSSSPNMYTAMSIDSTEGKVYWGGVGAISRANLDGSDVEVFDSSYSGLSEGVAVDSIAGKVYWTSLDGKIRRKAVNGSAVEILHDAGQSLHGLAIDPISNRLFWAAQDSGIYTSTCDGSNVTYVADGGIEALGVAYHQPDDQIYWADYQSRQIQRCRSDGTGQEVIFTSTFGNPIELTFSEDGSKLFWMEWTTKQLLEMDLDSGVAQIVRSFTYSPWGIAVFTPPPLPDFSYTINDKDPSTIILTGYTGSSNSIAIPSQIKGRTVTAVGKGAFQASHLRGITLPDTIVTLGDDVFRECADLETVVLPNNITRIPRSAFHQCASLESLTLPQNITHIDDFAFDRCAALKDITIPSGVKDIDSYAFQLCNSLTEIILPEGVKRIGSGAFGHCSNLKIVVLPDSIISIGSYAFQECAKLNNVALPEGITDIGGSTFKNCSRLRVMTIPARVESIGDGAFYGCGYLRGLYLKGNAPTISSDVFGGGTTANVFHLAPATGWTSTFSGQPAAVWNPRVLTNDETFGLQPNGFNFSISGTNDMWVVIEASDTLETNQWTKIKTISVDGSATFNDPQWGNYSTRFYRLTMP